MKLLRARFTIKSCPEKHRILRAICNGLEHGCFLFNYFAGGKEIEKESERARERRRERADILYKRQQ